MHAKKFISHRGDQTKFVENTLNAFRSALDQKVDMIEFDLRLSKDFLWVVSHDKTLVRTNHIEGWVHDYTAQELKTRFDIPQLEDALKLMENHCQVYLDIKGLYTRSGIKQLWGQLMNNSFPKKNIYLASFNQLIVRKLLKLKKKTPECQMKVGVITGSYLNLKRKKSLMTRLDFIGMHEDIVYPRYLEQIKIVNPNLEIFLYVLNDLLVLQHYYYMPNLDGLLSDDPSLFKQLQYFP